MILWQIILGLLVVAASAVKPTQTTGASKRNNGGIPPQFVTIQDGGYFVNGSRFNFVGTNAYWLPTLNNDQDIDNTLASIAAAGITVVRTWAFNDVETIPETGVWFQLIANGTTTINNGTNGLPRLDKVVELAQNHGVYLLLSLTNNWSPFAVGNSTNSTSSAPISTTPLDVTQGSNITFPRNTFSNDYGGMDLYVRQLGDIHEHDQFYSNETLINAYQNYTTQIVTRYKDSPSVLGWEIANDPRCNSSIATSPDCVTTVVTLWHNTIAMHIRSKDPNHLVSSGNQGFFCADCPKTFLKTAPPVVPAPAPQTSPAPGTRRRSIPEPLTKAKLLKERKALWKKTREMEKRSGVSGGIRVRGRWVASPTRRQDDVGVGPAFDGSQGVDSEDIFAIPSIDFGSFQLFPDMNSYGPDDPSLSLFDQILQTGLQWITRQVSTSQMLGKPISLTGFGLVTQNNAPLFVPVNGSVAPFALDQGQDILGRFVNDTERDEIYAAWMEAGRVGGVQGAIVHQWGQPNLTAQAGSTILPQNVTGTTPNQDITGQSPNDGYSLQGVGRDQAVGVISQEAAKFASDSGT